MIYQSVNSNSGIDDQFFQFQNWNWLFKKKHGLRIEKVWIGLKFPTKIFNPQIKLPFNFSEIFLP